MKLIKKLSLPLVFILIFSLLAGVFPQSTSAASIFSLDLYHKSTSESEIVPGKVIVKYKSSHASMHSFNVQSISPKVYTLSFSNDISVAAKINELQKDPDVEYAEPVYKIHFAEMSTQRTVANSVYFDEQHMSYMENWGKIVTGLDTAANLTSEAYNARAIVAVLDSGVDLTHPDLINSIVAGYDFIHNDNLAEDDNGHGTNVAGVIAAKSHDGVNAAGYSGVSPGTKIMPIKVMDSDGSGSTDNLVRGIQFAIDNHANIISMSLGSGFPSRALHDVIKLAVQNNILVVAAAGNDSNHWINNEIGQLDTGVDTHRYAFSASYPASFNEVISVGAIEQLEDGKLAIADFSNIEKVDVVAPGVNIYSTFLNGDYSPMSGTSQATPFVAGFAAMLKGYNPSLSVTDIRSIISSSAGGVLVPPIDSYGYENYRSEVVTPEMLYGNGLINADVAFNQSRLHIVPVQVNPSQSRTVTVDVYMEDLKGNVVQTSTNVQLILKQWKDESDIRSDDSQKASTSVNLSSGYARMSIIIPSNDPIDIYHNYVYAKWIDANSHDRRSNNIEFNINPQSPTSSLPSGTYVGNQIVSLVKTDQGAEIYFLLIGQTTANFGLYTGPFTVAQDSTLSIVTLKNHTASIEGEYTYNINPAPVTNTDTGTSQPSIPFIPFFPPGLDGSPTPTPTPTATPTPKPSDNQITKGDDGKSSLEVKPNTDYLIDLLNKSNDDVIIDAKSTQSLNAVSVNLDGNVMLKAKEKGTPIIIQSNDLQIHFAPDTIDYKDSKANVKFSAAISADQTLPSNIQSVSTIYDFNLSIDNVDTHTFNKPIEVHFTIDPTKIHNLNNVGVFYYNDVKQVWEYVGGTVNKDNTVTAFLPHFSKYAVLENTKSFNDIQGHWAKAEIEEMASKQIISGMTEQTFQPQLNITRAEFVSMLTRSLRLDSSSEGMSFSDIPAGAWYKKDVYSAFNANIIKGITEHTFAPEKKITREELATLLVNAYLKSTGKQLSDIVTTQEVKYSDEGNINSWARSNVRIATSLGLMSGVEKGKFNPAGFATRAEAAVVLKRFLDLVK